MKEVVDSNLVTHKTFGDMGSGLPRILINATTLTDRKRFVFSEERFKALNSRIDTFPVANAVMASSAVPAAFHDMTLRDHSVSNQEYLFRAAHYLIHLDNDRTGTPFLKRVCDWFTAEGVRDLTCGN
jgi:predicted acylesterase/phospholipase RssA